MMSTSTIKDVEKLFQEKNLDGLQQLVESLEDKNTVEARRAGQLLGDLQFADRRYQAALESYQLSQSATSSGNVSALFGIAVCYRMLGDTDNFGRAVTDYLEAAKEDDDRLSRLLLYAAEMPHREAYDRVKPRLDLEEKASEDSRIWYRVVRAIVAMDNLGNAVRLARQATQLKSCDEGQKTYFSKLISKHVIRQAEGLFKDKDIEGLSRLADRIEDRNTAEARRARQLLGDLLMNSGRFQDALKQFEMSHNAQSGGNPAAVFGSVVCYRNLGDQKNFAQMVSTFIDSDYTNDGYLSRMLLLAAEQADKVSYDRIIEVLDLEGNGCVDARTWHRAAKAMVVMGDRERAVPLAQKAKELASGDSDILLLVAELDYDINEYWEKRYNSSQGERTPLMVSQQTDSAYQEVTDRDIAFLETTLHPRRSANNWLKSLLGKKETFQRAVDCGCGSGRLVSYLAGRVNSLTCFDISQTAVKFARENNPGVSNVTFEVANLASHDLPEGSFDLVFDFTAIQHVADRDQWRRVLKNYVNACETGGTIYLVEAIGDDERQDLLHQTNASPDTYIKTAEEFGARFVKRIDTPWPDHCALIFTK